MRAVTIALIGALVLGTAALGAVSLSGGDAAPAPEKSGFFQTEEVRTASSLRTGFSVIPYDAVTGTIIVHPKGWDDTPVPAKVKPGNPEAEASMFFVAYFRKGANPASRPVTFLFNGGPGSATVWLHMGAFGPKRVVTVDDRHTPAAPYKVVDNASSLLDASDLVFIDAPGTGFSRVAGKDKEKAFFGIDQDAHAFASFIKQFLSRYGRWNSPKYLFGESYGTTRAAVVVNKLATEEDTDFNGVIMLSQILNFDLSPDEPAFNPGVDLPYQLVLPTYAATAWYHNKLPGKRPENLVAFVQQVERFAMGEYAAALSAGNSLDRKRRAAIADKLHRFTGLPVWYILKANLRIDGGMFGQTLQGEVTTGRLDTRFSGPAMDPLSKTADYDPQSAAISSAYVSAFNAYVRSELKFGQGRVFKPGVDLWKSWDYQHQPPGASRSLSISTNVMPDLAVAMKHNPNLKVLLTAGYFDLATPYYEGWYEMHHLPIPASLQGNIEYEFYPSGHMIYAHEESLKKLHDRVADFIGRTSNVK